MSIINYNITEGVYMNVELLYKDIKVDDGDYLVLGCSYGPDSMALFKTLLELRKIKKINIVQLGELSEVKKNPFKEFLSL